MKSLFLIGFLFFCIIQFLRVCALDLFLIPSSSMSPTLNPGNRVIVNKNIMGGRIYKDLSFDLAGQELRSFRLNGVRQINYNDICVFNQPKHKNGYSFIVNKCFCKRCIALPGDTLSIENGFYCNNNYSKVLGVKSEQELLLINNDTILNGKNVIGHEFGWNQMSFGPLYIPRKGDCINITSKEASLYKNILSWELRKTIRWNQDSDIVTAGKDTIRTHIFQHDFYFMAGDNVHNSIDSRYWGLVPEEYIIGVVVGVLKIDNIDN